MPRAIGEIEIMVVANTRKLKVQAVKGAKEAGEAAGEALEEGLSDIESTELMAKLRKIRIQAQQAMAGIAVDFEVDMVGLKTELKRVEAQLKAAEMELLLHPEVDDPELRKTLAETRKKVAKAAPAKIEGVLTFDRRTAIEAVEEANTWLEMAEVTVGAKIEIPVDEIAEAQAQMDAQIKDLVVKIERIDGKREASLARAEIEAIFRGISVDASFEEARERLAEYAEETEALRLLLDVGADLSKEDMEQIRTDYKGYKARIERDKIRVQLELDAESIYDDAATAQEALERIGVTWRVDLGGLDEAVSEADATRFAIEKNKVQLQFSAAKGLAEEIPRIEAAKKAIEKDAIRFNINLATALGLGEAELKTFLAKERNIKLGMDVDMAGAAAKLEVELLAIERTLPTVDYELEAKNNEAILAGQIAKINATAAAGIRDFDMNVNVGYDKASKAKTDAAIKANMNDTGKKSGQGLGKNIAGGLADQGTLIVGAVATMAQPIAQGLSGGLAAASSVISSGISAIGSAAGAAAPIVAGFGGALAAVVVGSKGFGTALDAISGEFEAAAKEGRAVNLETGEVAVALSKLSPSARATAVAFAGFKDELHDIKLGVQEKLFSGFADVIDDLGKDVLPDVGKALETMAKSVNEFGRQLADVAKKTDWSGIAEGLKPALDNAFDAATALVETVEPFLKAAAPAADKLARMIEKVAENMRDWMQATDNQDKLAEFLDDGLDSLEAWAELTSDVTDLLITFFNSGRESGDSFVSSLSDMVERWDRFLESTEGQEDLANFFESGRETMDALKPVLDGLQEAFSTLIGDSGENFKDLADSLGAALPDFAELLSVTSQLGIAEAFLNIMDAAGPLFDLLTLIPDELLEMAGMAFAIYKIAKAFDAIRKSTVLAAAAMKAFSASHPALLALTVVMGAAILLWDQFSRGSEEMEGQLKAQNNAMRDATDALIEAGTAADDSTVAIEGMNDALEGGIEGVDTSGLKKAFGEINELAGKTVLTSDEMAQTLMDVDKEPVAALGKVAQAMGLPTAEAEKLAQMVNDTNDNFSTLASEDGKYISSFQEISDATGIPTETLRQMAASMEFVQDQADESDLGAFAQEQLDLAAGGEDAEIAMLKEAEAIAAANGAAGDAQAIYEAYAGLKNKAARESENAADAEYVYGDSIFLVEQAMWEANAAANARKDALVKTGQEAYTAYKNEQLMRQEIEDGADEAAAAAGMSQDYADALVDVGENARDAADAADSLKESFDLLVGPGITVQETFSNMQQAIDDFDIAIKGGQEALDLREEALEKGADAANKYADAQREDDPERRAGLEADAAALQAEADAANNAAAALETAAVSLDLNTQAGRDNAELLRGHASDVIAWTAAQVQAGIATDVIESNLAGAREQLEKEAEAFGKSESEAKAYVDVLLGAPEFMSTLIQTPGLVEALLGAENLEVMYDELGQPVYPTIEALGVDRELTRTQEFQTALETLGLIHATPTVDASGAIVAEETVAAVATTTEALNEATGEPTVTVPTAEDATTDVEGVQSGIKTLGDSEATPNIRVTNVEYSLSQIRGIETAMARLKDKTINITIKTTGAVPTIPGTTPARGRPGGMAGRMINGPLDMRVGERGYREALIPLDLPMHRINPEVRALAALIRGEGGTELRVAGGKTVNNYMTITPNSADPSAVATKIINRAAAFARG